MLKTPRLFLRTFTAADAEPLFQVFHDGDVFRFFPNPSPPALPRVLNFIERQIDHEEKYGYGFWAVERQADRALLGWCGLQYLPETGETEVGYLLGKASWGQGFATEAARACLRAGFQTFSLEQIVAIVHPRNAASIHVIDKLGMTFVDRTYYFGIEVLRYRLAQAAFSAQVGQG
jgi:ribosomal-protein-alanine N-acetyltransferase